MLHHIAIYLYFVKYVYVLSDSHKIDKCLKKDFFEETRDLRDVNKQRRRRKWHRPFYIFVQVVFQTHYRLKISDPVRFDKKSSLQSQNYSGDLFEICLILSLNIYIVP